MDVKTFVDLVNTVGVPVAVIIGLGVGMFWIINYNMKNTDKIMIALNEATKVASESTNTNKELADTNKEQAETIRVLVEKHDIKIDRIGDKLDILINK